MLSINIFRRFTFWLTLSSICVAWATVGATQFNLKDESTTLLLISNPLFMLLSHFKWDGETTKLILKFLRYLNIIFWVVIGLTIDLYMKTLREKGQKLLDKTDLLVFYWELQLLGY